MKDEMRKCPECEGITLYTRTVASGTGHGPVLLPGLGGFLQYARLEVVLCTRCGLTRFYAQEEAREKVARARGWRPL